MARARVTIDCHHCGKRTSIDLQEEMSTQRCQKCGMRLSAVNTSAKQKRRKRVGGDPMIKRYMEAETRENLKRKRRRFVSRKLRTVRWILILLFFGIIVTTIFILLRNPMGAHRPW